MFKKLTTCLLSICGAAICVFGQNTVQPLKNNWYFGFGGGINYSQMEITKLDKDYYPDKTNHFSGVFSFFFECDFGPRNCIGIRPQLSFLTRGGGIDNIGKNFIEDYIVDPEFPDDIHLSNIGYRVKATYMDVRLPIMFQFCKTNSKFRPYIYIAPIFGVTTSGYVAAFSEYSNNAFEGYKYDASKANMSTTYFAAAAGVGLKYQFNISHSTFFLGIDFNYQYGFSNTFGSGERNGKLESALLLRPDDDFSTGKVEGSRRFSCMEVQATLGIPFSIFKKSTPVPTIVIPETITPIASIQTEMPTEKPCYTLEEINQLIRKGESIDGKTICAVDDINFAFAKSEIDKNSYAYLDKLAQAFKRMNAKICVTGHTDNIGSEETNLELSKQRAIAVVNYLISKGVDPSKLTYSYFGMSQPLTSNDTEEGRKLNRRVEFKLTH